MILWTFARFEFWELAQLQNHLSTTKIMKKGYLILITLYLLSEKMNVFNSNCTLGLIEKIRVVRLITQLLDCLDGICKSTIISSAISSSAIMSPMLPTCTCFCFDCTGWYQIFCGSRCLQVFNTAETIRLVRQNSSRARVFALGLGSSASHHLVEGIARAGNGTALFASLEERLETKVMRQLQDALQPAMTDVRVEWQGWLTEDPSAATAAVVVQTEKTLLGFGKPVKLPGQLLVEMLKNSWRQIHPYLDTADFWDPSPWTHKENYIRA